MARSRFEGLIVLSLVLALASNPFARSDDAKPTTTPVATPELVPQIPVLVGTPASQSTEQGNSTCRIYSIGEWSNDPSFGKWIAETIPEVIQPGSWNSTGGKNVLRYNAPTGILVVYHTPATHTQIEAFLQNVKRSLPQGKEWTSANKNAFGKAQSVGFGGLVPAKYTPADSTRTNEPAASKSTSYPVPTQATQPKHLFHFIIRYEGEGIIDSTVAGVLKQLYGTEESEDPSKGPKKKKKKSNEAAKSEQTSSTPALDQLFHLIVRYEGEGIIDATVADVIKAVYSGSGSNNTTSGNGALGVIRGCGPSSMGTSLPTSAPPTPMFVPAPNSPLPVLPAPKPPEPSSSY